MWYFDTRHEFGFFFTHWFYFFYFLNNFQLSCPIHNISNFLHYCENLIGQPNTHACYAPLRRVCVEKSIILYTLCIVSFAFHPLLTLLSLCFQPQSLVICVRSCYLLCNLFDCALVISVTKTGLLFLLFRKYYLEYCSF